MSAVKNHFHEEIEMRAMFDRDSNLTREEAFEILETEGVKSIDWDNELNRAYSDWIYLNLK